MNERLEQFLAAENISQAAFADKLKVTRPSISHILTGRNQPGYDFFARLIKNYPSLNIEWLITGKGRMYKDFGSGNTLFDSPGSEVTSVNQETPPDSPLPLEMPDSQELRAENGSFINEEPQSRPDVSPDTPPAMVHRQRKAVKIIVFYDDNTFEEFKK